MNLRKPKQNITFIFFVLAVCFVLSSFIGFSSSISLDTVFYDDYDDMVLAPLDYEVVPIDDGTKIEENSPLLMILFWQKELFSFIDSMFVNTPYHDFIRFSVIPFLSVILSGAIIFILFSRRDSPEKNPNSAPAKILAYVEKHQGSTQQRIIQAVSRSRGSVSYQLKRLEKEKKIYTCTVSDKKYYFTNPVSVDSLEFEIMKILADENLREIFTLLYDNKKFTRNSIAEFLKKSPDTVYYHLKKISQDIIIQNREGHADCYSLTEKARTVYSMMGIDGCVNEAQAEA